MPKPPKPLHILPLIFFAFALLFVACASTKNVSAASVDDSEVLTELPAKVKKSRLKIVPTEDPLIAERAVWFGLYYDGKRVAADVSWESSDTSVMRLMTLTKEPGLSCIGFCLLPKKVTLSATVQSVTVQRTFTIQPARREGGLQIMLPERTEFPLGSQIAFVVLYDGINVVESAVNYTSKHATPTFPVYVLRHKDLYRLFCLSAGETYVLVIYKDDAVFRTVTVSEAHSALSIRIPETAVLKAGNSVNLSAICDGKDVTEAADWQFLYLRDHTSNAVAEYTDRKGEVICKSSGTIFAIACYQEDTAFVQLDVTE